MGKTKVKTIVRRKLEQQDGSLADGDVITETESDVPANHSVLSHWLYHHDPEWFEKEIAGKKLDVTTNGKDVNGTQLIFAATPLTEKDIQEIKNIKDGITEEDSTDPGLSET